MPVLQLPAHLRHTPTCRPLLPAAQTQAKVTHTQQVLRSLKSAGAGGASGADDGGGSSGGLNNVLAVAAKVAKDLEGLAREKFEDWQDSTRQELGKLKSLGNTRLLSFDAQRGHVKTEFNEQLVTLLREVRAHVPTAQFRRRLTELHAHGDVALLSI